jgi:glycosyltransferase involved in cell wall biosynthesis
MKSPITVIILTYNEEKHIQRCIHSVLPFTNDIVIMDSNSTDNTCEIARRLGAKIYINKWVNYATQFNFALDNCSIDTEWVMRLDADEVVTEQLASKISKELAGLKANVSGIYVKRRIVFLGKWIKHGGIYPSWMLRVFRHGKGKCELRWMDEHIKLTTGESIRFDEDIIDDNNNNLAWWTEKHAGYAKREMVDLLNLKFNFFAFDEVTPDFFGSQEQRKRWLKIKYATLPLFIRPFSYFIFRYFVQLGFLDGKVGGVWHFLQGFWYRFLVDAIILDVFNNAGHDKEKVKAFILSKYQIDLDA